MERSKDQGGERQTESISEGTEQGKVLEEWELNPDIQEGSAQGELQGVEKQMDLLRMEQMKGLQMESGLI